MSYGSSLWTGKEVFGWGRIQAWINFGRYAAAEQLPHAVQSAAAGNAEAVLQGLTQHSAAVLETPPLPRSRHVRDDLWRGIDDRLRVDVRTPVRNAITVASPPRSIGWVFAPNVSMDYRGIGHTAGWNLGVQAGPIYAQRHYDAYFYTVAPQYATAVRPAYQAPGGYAGSQLLVAISKRYANYWVGAYVRHDWLQRASFIDSPLVQQQGYWAGGVAIVWIITASSRMVDSDE